MRVQFSQHIDFNQMLVFSVFGHLLLLTFVLFLPKPHLPEKVVVPAFMVNLVSEPTGFKSAAPKHSKPLARAKKAKDGKKKVEKKPAPKKQAKKTLVKKKTTPSKPAKSKAILEALNKLEAKTALAILPGKTLVEELDQVARLEKPKHKPLASKPIKKKTVTEETFRELEALKNKKVNEIKAIAPVPLHKDILGDIENLKMGETLPETPQKKASPEKKQEPALEKKQAEKSKGMDLLKELDQLAKLDASPVLVPDIKTAEPGVQEEASSEPFDSVMEKLGSLSVESEPVKVEVSSARLDATSFKSKLRSLPKTSRVTTESGTGESYVLTKKEGTPGADVQSLYVGLIQERIYKNWREPLAEEHNQETVVSFFIFPGGNVDKPFVKKSSGVEGLDTLAVRAVLDSVPFPAFPKGLKMSNLHINIYFKYVPKDK